MNLVDQMLSGDRLALSRLISQVENRTNLLPVMRKVQEHCGKGRVVGITGPPGSGKSTLVDQMITHYRREGEKIGVVAIDPSSPFSGGAVLGDRIRMQAHAGDDGVFIRSLGSRGSHGGLSRATREVVKLYDAFGMDRILVETVGVGQTELDIRELAATTIVILTPESGDAIQTLKAGILEIADLFVVNKAEREGADRLIAELKGMLDLGPSGQGWKTPVLPLQALQGVGVPELMRGIEDHQAYLRSVGKKGRQSLADEVREIVLDELRKKMKVNGLGNPYQSAERILRGMGWGKLKASTPRRPSSLRSSTRRTRRRSARR